MSDPSGASGNRPHPQQNLALKLGLETGWIDNAQGVALREPYLQLYAPFKRIVEQVGSEAFVTLLYLALVSEADAQGRIVCDYTAGEIAAERGLRRQTVSEHIKKLKAAGLVRFEQERGAHHTFGESRYVIYPFADVLAAGSQLTPLPVRPGNGPGEKSLEMAAAKEADSGGRRLPVEPLPASAGTGLIEPDPQPLPVAAVAGGSGPDAVAVVSDEENSSLSGRADSGLLDQVAVAALVEQGVIGRVARKLVREQGAEACLQQLAWLPERSGVENPAAFLVRAIEEQFSPPPERPTAPPVAVVEPDPEEVQAEVEHEAVQARLSSLPTAERERLLAAAETEVLAELRAQEFLRLMLDRGERPAWVAALIAKRACDQLDQEQGATPRRRDAADGNEQLGLLAEGAA